MQPSASIVDPRILAGIVFLMLANWMLSSTAKAGCSDYVTVRGMRIAEHAPIDRSEAAIHNRELATVNFRATASEIHVGIADGTRSSAPVTAPMDGRRRCSGPSCSGDRPVRDIPVPNVVPMLDQWGLFVPKFRTPATSPAAIAGQDDSAPAPSSGLGIYHPPRPAA